MLKLNPLIEEFRYLHCRTPVILCYCAVVKNDRNCDKRRPVILSPPLTDTIRQLSDICCRQDFLLLKHIGNHSTDQHHDPHEHVRRTRHQTILTCEHTSSTLRHVYCSMVLTH